jgi:hypothetical protein
MLQEARKGILGLDSSYNEEKKRWNQAHTQGAYVITQYIMQNQKSDIISLHFKVNDRGRDDFFIEVNKTNFLNEGHELIGKLLKSFQIWKSLGAVEDAREFYAHYSKVGETEMKIKHILNSVPKQQAIRLFQNIEKKQKGKLKFDMARNEPDVVPSLRSYQRNFIGVIKSYIDRIPFSVGLYNQIIGEWNKTKKYLRRPREAQINLSQTKSHKKKSQKHKAKKTAKKVNPAK